MNAGLYSKSAEKQKKSNPRVESVEKTKEVSYYYPNYAINVFNCPIFGIFGSYLLFSFLNVSILF